MVVPGYYHDYEWTLRNRANLLSNRNLLSWYERLYEKAFSPCEDFSERDVLEIGSGASPLKIFYNRVITSDILELPYIDYVFDCHNIDVVPFIDRSFDIITMTNVLHHLQDPVNFLCKASSKLKEGGLVIAIEPYFSLLSSLIYRLLHHEKSDFSVEQPRLSQIIGPLGSANMALPQMIFLNNNGWSRPLHRFYDFSTKSVEYFTSLSYMATGGISRQIRCHSKIYRLFLNLDIHLAALFPKILASFFIIRLRKKG